MGNLVLLFTRVLKVSSICQVLGMNGGMKHACDQQLTDGSRM